MMTYTIDYRQALTILRALEYYNANIEAQPLTKHEKRADFYHSKEMIKLFTNE